MTLSAERVARHSFVPSYSELTAEQWRAKVASTTMGDPDGPDRYVDYLDETVPTFIDPRLDLVSPRTRNDPKLDVHIPFKKRGIYKAEWLPEEYFERNRGSIKVDLEGYVICGGSVPTGDGGFRPCAARARNRCGFCNRHGGALHPADKKMSAQNIVAVPEDRVEKLDRVQKFMQGFLKFEDLDDEEVLGAFIRNDEGRPIASTKLGDTIHQGLTKELLKRMNRFMQMKLPNMLKVIADIAESPIAEPADRHKAAVWMAERVMGKNPDVVLFGKSEAHYESILDQIESGSRESFRNQSGMRSLDSANNAGRIAGLIDGEVIDGEIDEDEDDVVYDPSGQSVTAVGNSGQDRNHAGTVGDVRRVGQSDTATTVGGTESDLHTGDDVDPTGLVAGGLASAQMRIDSAKEARQRIKDAKRRRFAARATGANGLDQIPWIYLRTPIKDGSGWRLKWYPPSAQTERTLELWRIQEQQNGLAQLARVAADYAAQLNARVEALKGA